jgi:hypothetical protein
LRDISLPSTVKAATVLLAIEAHRLGDVAAIRVALPEVDIEKLGARFLGYFISYIFEEIMLLMGANE